MTITSVLVANRGEIARRVLRTCRDLGIGTVAVYSDADTDSIHVDEADAAVRLPGTAPRGTYLRTELIIEAAVRAGADAIHPGYGFLAENAPFARAVEAAGITWIGPPAAAIEAMGNKIESKRLMAAAGVPVLELLHPAAVTGADLPVLIKASAGGGGHGMRVVDRLADLAREIELTGAEAEAAFADPTVFCERYLAATHHVEVQIMADAHGTVWAVGERECSIQRRYQKIVEEAPSPLVERVEGVRKRLFDAARAAAGVVGYRGAGTVEFLLDTDGQFFFLEMNTRLQVEHPVTECTTGLDLVALQLHVADGGHLDARPPAIQGHSIEARLYAEDPAEGWRPQTGTLHRITVPGVAVEFGTDTAPAGIRLDSGVQDGSIVGTDYDPLLAKVISWAPSRQQAARSLADALARSTIHGLVTNRNLLVNVLRHKAFLAGETDSAFFARHGLDTLAPLPAQQPAEAVSAVAAALAIDAVSRATAPVLAQLPSGWRNVAGQPQSLELDGPGGRHTVAYRYTRDGCGVVYVDGVAPIHVDPSQVVLEVHGVRRRFAVARYGPEVYVDSALGSVRFTVVDRFAVPGVPVPVGTLLAPMPGTVARTAVAAREVVVAGQPILWLEAMKMQHRIDAPADGVVAELPVRPGQQVAVGTVLAVLIPAGTAPGTAPDEPSGTGSAARSS